MAWLNFNDSLNSLKGQISNFANNVLADEEEDVHREYNYGELKQLCEQQALEIQRLKQVNKELEIKQSNQNGFSPNDTWGWDSNEGQQTSSHSESEVSHLKATIAKLEHERQELLTKLDHLDSDNQDNLLKVVTIRKKLQEELAQLQEKYSKLEEENTIATQNETKLKHEIQKFQEKIVALGKLDSNGSLEILKEKNDSFLVDNQKTRLELEEAKKELSVLKSSSSTLHKVFEDYKHATEKEIAENIETIKKIEGENKIIYNELQKAKGRIKSFEQKSLEDDDNCSKLAVILETYEQEVSSLKGNLKVLQAQNEELTKPCSGQTDTALEEQLETSQSAHQDTNKIDDEKIKELEVYVKKMEEFNLLENSLENMKEEKTKLEQIFTESEEKHSLESEKLLQEINLLKQEQDNLNRKNIFLQTKISDLISNSNVELDSSTILKETVLELRSLNEKIVKENNSLKMDIEVLTDKCRSLKIAGETNQKQFDSGLTELHNKYVTIFTDNLRKSQDHVEPSNNQCMTDEEDDRLLEFRKQMQNIFQILNELRYKCQELEKKVFDLTEEKTTIMTEKNYEIKKLLHNSEILSQEVLNKTQMIKEYENEMNELAKNNELLINELENYKNNPGLQTISESNEDNIVLLETQLENANKRIEDLERLVDDIEYQKVEHENESKEDIKHFATQLENANKHIEDLEKIIDDLEIEQKEKAEKEMSNALKQLNITGDQLLKDQDYQTLLGSHLQLQNECEILKNNLESLYKDLEKSNELKANFEKIKADYENMEYQLSEFHINTEISREDLEQQKLKVGTLLKDNDKLRMLYEESAQTNEDLRGDLKMVKEKLLIEEDSRKNFEIQVTTLIEKLQNAKMNETSLKLQYDTICKELKTTVDLKNSLELSLSKVNQDLKEFQNNFIFLQTQNDQVLSENLELKNVIINRENCIKELQIKLAQLGNIAVDENCDLLEKLPISENNPKQIDQLQSSFKKMENIILEENGPKLDNLSLVNNEERPLTEVDIERYNEIKAELGIVTGEKNKMEQELQKMTTIQSQLINVQQMCAMLQQQLQETTNSRNELVNIVTAKHKENVAYHNEIQRLSHILNNETEKCRNYEIQITQLNNKVSDVDLKAKNVEIEKLSEQNCFLKEKCEIMANNLLEEQAKVCQLMSELSNPSEKEITLHKNLDRLQAHLIEVEDHYTQELLQSEKKISELQGKMNELEEREKSSSNMYTSVSIRANQQVESLQAQLQTVVNERDSLRNMISDAEDNNKKQAAALSNLQFVLEQFRRDKEKDVQKETERIRRHITAEKTVQEELKKEIVLLKAQLEESNQGLLAAARLSDQLETSKNAMSMLKEEVSQLQIKLANKEDELKVIATRTDGKVDKSLVRNLIMGFVSSNSNNLSKDQHQILKIIATVLDFSQQDHDKINLSTQQRGSWLSSFLAPPPGHQTMTQESLSQAFIKFLENESKPKVVPNLLNSDGEAMKTTIQNTSSSPRQSPIVLTEIVLPTFADFAQTRNSSSILKDVLKDSS